MFGMLMMTWMFLPVSWRGATMKMIFRFGTRPRLVTAMWVSHFIRLFEVDGADATVVFDCTIWLYERWKRVGRKAVTVRIGSTENTSGDHGLVMDWRIEWIKRRCLMCCKGCHNVLIARAQEDTSIEKSARCVALQNFDDRWDVKRARQNRLKCLT